MTCIVGLQHKKRVYLGGDSAATGGNLDQTIIGDKKVFVNGDIAFGICGSPKIIDPLTFTKFPKQQRGTADREFIAKELVPAIKAAFTASGCVIQHPEHGEVFHGAILFGYRGKLYRMECNFQVITNAYGFDAVGSGADIALGSLHASTKVSNPQKRILQALEASALNNAGVRPPFAIVSVK